jgi:hypothetical protein
VVPLSGDRANCTEDTLRVAVEKDETCWKLDFSPRRNAFFEFADNPGTTVEISYGDERLPLTDFLNEYPLNF